MYLFCKPGYIITNGLEIDQDLLTDLEYWQAIF